MYPGIAHLQQQIADHAERLGKVETAQQYQEKSLADIQDTQKRHTWLLIGSLVSIVSGCCTVLWYVATHVGPAIVQQLITARMLGK